MPPYRTVLASGLLVIGAAASSLAQRASEAAPAPPPEEFGIGSYTVSVIQAASFTSDTPVFTEQSSLFRDFGQGSGGDFNSGHFFAGVNVPSGAVIDFIGLESFDPNDGGGHLVATLFYVDRHGLTSGIVTVPSTDHSYATDYNPAALGALLTQNAQNALVLDVYMPGGGNVRPEFGWVEIWWKRTVSPAPASPTFVDVPPTDPGFQYIEALAASQITGGCGNGNYCPDTKLTRRQMAIFLAKSLGLHWPY